LKRAFNVVVDKYGTLDVMVSNAGLGFGDQSFNRALDPKEPENVDENGDGTEPGPWALMAAVNISAGEPSTPPDDQVSFV
jgi:NADP-dependent 3-hydroxy acid dehydrogenase YdfG